MVFTATDVEGVDDVRISIDGSAVDVFPTGEGLVLDGPIGRSWFEGTGVLPRIFVDTPAYGEVVPPTFELAGLATNIFEAVFDWELSLSGGEVIAEGTVTADGAFGSQPFRTTVTVPDPEAIPEVAGLRQVTLTVYAEGARAGEPRYLRSQTLVLDPGR